MGTSLIAIESELEQMRRGLGLLVELSVSLRLEEEPESLFISTARSINDTLNMQRTAILVQYREQPGYFKVGGLHGYSSEDRVALAGKQVKLPPGILKTEDVQLVTGASPEDQFAEVREFLGLPYFVSCPIVLQGEVFAVLFTGRAEEAPPDLPRLSKGDAEIIQAIAALLASVLTSYHLAAAEERNRILINAAPICCVLWNEVGQLADCNIETLKLFAVTEKDTFLQHFYEYFPQRQPDGSDSFEMIKRHVRRAFIRGSSLGRWVVKTQNEELISTEVTMVRAPKGGDYILAAYLRDMRDHESAQAKLDEARSLAKQYTKAKNEFLASVSHEIRTPMTAINAMAQLTIASKDLSKEQKKIIQQGQRAILLVTSAIEAILDFSKLDSGQLLLESEEFSIQDMVDEILHLVHIDAENKGLDLSAVFDSLVPPRVLGDSLRLQQALLNIVNNAIKFTEHGSVLIKVSTEKSVLNNQVVVVFEVIDTGIGISEDISELFKPLYSLDSGYDRKYGGLGMGLPISKSLTTLMGGKMTVESTLGEGSNFKFIIPLDLPEDTLEEPERPKTSTDFSALKGLRVLVAEDNAVNQMIIEELLTVVGIHVTIANNGIEALELLQKSIFDLVIMDIQMPEMDGLTATAQIRNDERFVNIPILAMTANAGPEHVAESLRAGMNAHLTKPVDVEELYKALIQWSGHNGVGMKVN